MTRFLKRLLILCLSASILLAAKMTNASGIGKEACAFLPADVPAVALAVDIESGDVLLECDKHDLMRTPFPTGSLVKVFSAAVALDRFSFNPDTKFFCSKSDADALQLESCWYHPGHGNLDLVDAIALSCNRYFINLAAYVEYTDFVSVLKRLNFQIDILRKQMDVDRETINITGLGRDIKATPLAVAYAFSSLFNGGDVFEKPGGKPTRKVVFNDSTIDIIREGMHSGALKGTSANAAEEAGTPDFLGKTGTAEYEYDGETTKYKTHAWWVGLYPASRPKTAVVVFVLEGSGASTAAPAGGGILNMLIRNQKDY